MKDFQTQILLTKYFELGGTLVPNQMLLCVDNYPCIFISKRMKLYTDREDGYKTKLMHYKVEMQNSLYPKGKIMDCFASELSVPMMVSKVDIFTF